MGKVELIPFAVTELSQAPVGGTVVVASWASADLSKASIETVDRHTPGGRIVLADGSQFARSGETFKQYGGNGSNKLYRSDPVLVDAVNEAQDRDRKKREARSAMYDIHEKSTRLGHGARAEDHEGAKALNAIVSSWPLTAEEQARLAELARDIVGARQNGSEETGRG